MALVRWTMGGDFNATADRYGVQSGEPMTSPIKKTHTVTADSALQVSAVWACVDLISRSVAALPIDVFNVETDGRKTRDRRCPLHLLLAVSPNSEMTPFEFWQTMTMHRLIRGNAYALITRDKSGSAYSLNPLNPDQMSVTLESDGVHYFYWNRKREIAELNRQNVCHWKGLGNGILGLSVLDFMRASVGEAITAQNNAVDMFSNGGKAQGILSTSQVLSPKQAEDMGRRFAAARADGRVPVLPYQVDFRQMSLSPADTELLNTRKFSVEEICRWFGVPSELIGGGDYEESKRRFYEQTILPLCQSAEQMIVKRVACASERISHEVRFRLSSINRASDRDRMSIYATAVQNGIMTRNEVRRLEDLADFADADDLTAQTNLVPLGRLGETDASQTSQTPLTSQPQKQ